MRWTENKSDMKEVTEEEKREIDLANWATVYPESMEDLKRRIENLDLVDHDTLFDTFEDIPEILTNTQNVRTTLNALQCIQEYENYRL